jgi:hypothetical protein
MAVRVRISIDPPNPGAGPLESTAVLNGGFESERPCLLLPAAAAAKILRRMPEDSDRIVAEVAGGTTTFLLACDNLTIRIVTPERKGPAVACDAIVSMGDREILVSDTAIDALGVEVRSFGKGLWKFSDEDRNRPSEPPQYW